MSPATRRKTKAAPKDPAAHQRRAARLPSINEVLAASRAATARAATPARDPTGEYHRRARELADQVGADVGEVLDEWDERAAVRQYDGGTARDDAERLAFEDVEERYLGQRSLLAAVG